VRKAQHTPDERARGCSGMNIMDHGFPTVLYCLECGFPQMRVLPDAESAGAVRFKVRCLKGCTLAREACQVTVAATLRSRDTHPTPTKFVSESSLKIKHPINFLNSQHT
jgi:hypothetical protein